MDANELRELLDQYLTDSLTPEGKAALIRAMEAPESLPMLESLMESDFIGERYVESENLNVKEGLHAWLKEKIAEAPAIRPARNQARRLMTRISIAASVALTISAAAYFLSGEKDTRPVIAIVADTVHDAQPATYKAKLTLANGKTIVLDSLVHLQNAAAGLVSMSADSVLLFNPGGSGSSAVVTNKGETFSFKLPDGSQVWLNSASRVEIPAAYLEKERRIIVSGEVYVKVAANPSKPFISDMNGVEVTALGTEFNLNAYENEPRPTATLVSGRVRVSSRNAGQASMVLAPGQQAQLLESGQLIQRKATDLERIIAWKEGLFHFENADLETVLREFARWYDIQIVYQDKPSTNRKFFGIVRRSNTLVQVLEILKDNEIKFTVNGKQLIVSTK